MKPTRGNPILKRFQVLASLMVCLIHGVALAQSAPPSRVDASPSKPSLAYPGDGSTIAKRVSRYFRPGGELIEVRDGTDPLPDFHRNSWEVWCYYEWYYDYDWEFVEVCDYVWVDDPPPEPEPEPEPAPEPDPGPGSEPETCLEASHSCPMPPSCTPEKRQEINQCLAESTRLFDIAYEGCSIFEHGLLIEICHGLSYSAKALRDYQCTSKYPECR